MGVCVRERGERETTLRIELQMLHTNTHVQKVHMDVHISQGTYVYAYTYLLQAIISLNHHV